MASSKSLALSKMILTRSFYYKYNTYANRRHGKKIEVLFHINSFKFYHVFFIIV